MLATMEAQSGLDQAETEVQVRARMNRASTGQRYWWLSRTGRNSGSGSDGGGGGWKAQGSDGGSDHSGGKGWETQGCCGGRGWERESKKCEK